MSQKTSMELAGAISLSTVTNFKEMTPIRLKILDLLINMTESQRQKSENGTAYCYAGQQWLADQVGCCRATVNRTVKYLKESGLVSTQLRAKRGGRFRTLLYFAGATLRKGLAHFKALILKSYFCVTEKLHISSDKDKISSTEVAKRSKTIKINSPPADCDYFEAIATAAMAKRTASEI